MKSFSSLCLISVVACWTTASLALGSEQRVGLVASVLPIAFIAREVGGDRVQVDVLVPPGASPHTFEPVPSDIIKLQGARFFLRVGAGLDGWSDKLLAAAPGTLTTLTLIEAPGLKPLEGDGHDHGHDDHKEHKKKHDDHGHDDHSVSKSGNGEDPHFWLDPIRVRDAVVPMLAHYLIEADPGGRGYFEERAEDFQRRLTDLDNRVRREFAKVRGRKFVAFHNSWGYFSERYNLEKVAVVQEFAGEEPTPKEVANLVRGARNAGIRSILVEPQFSPRLAITISGEFGGRTVMVDPLGDVNDSARSGYEKLILFNSRAFAQALGGMRN